MKTTKEDYDIISKKVFNLEYAGYRPTVKEIPNGDGNVDNTKRFAHVAEKYTKDAYLLELLYKGHQLALSVAKALNIPEAFMPVRQYSALRVLEYPVGSFSYEHEDFDLFTLMLYRDQPDKFNYHWDNMPSNVKVLNEQCHLGQIAAELGVGQAVKHSVSPSDTVQHSIVYFAIPDHKSILPSGISVGNWLEERLARSRVY
jgi:hypothetical protein